MAFEHEQFRRFLQNDRHFPPSPSPSPNVGRRIRPSLQMHQPPKINNVASGPYQQQQQAARRRHYSASGKKVSWSTGESGGKRRCEPLTPRGRVAALIVCLKLTMLCCWLVHELASGFDESHCLLLATNFTNSQTPKDNIVNWPPPPISGNSPSQMTKLSGPPKNEAAKGIDNDDDGDGGVNILEWRQTKEKEGQQRTSEPTIEQNRIPSSNSDNPSDEQSSAAKVQSPPVVPKRRRKVILRRRLLRKGATGAGGPSASYQSSTDGQPKLAGTGGGGTVRRVVWRVVPLKKLPLDSEMAENDGNEEAEGNAQMTTPMRTKTGTVMLRMGNGQQPTKLRRITRRRITPNGNSGAAGRKEEAGLDMSLIRESAWRKKSAAGKAEEQQGEAPSQSPPPKLAALYSVLNGPDQLDALVNAVFCYARTIFDCWCLLQCFCSALFLLGLHIRHRMLALFPVVVDFVSIVLGLIFGISTMMFPLILLFLLPNLPSKPLLLCFGLSAAIHLAVAIYAWSTFLQLKAVNSGAEEEEEEKKMMAMMGRRKSTGGSIV